MAGDPEETPHFTVKKKVDESWKESIQKEKDKVPGPQRPGAEKERPAPKPGPARTTPASPSSNFPYFVSTLGMQALAALGEIEDPVTGGVRVDLQQAQYLIDILHTLAEKTKGNLTPEEEAMLDNLLYELRTKFVEKNTPQ